MTFDDGKNQDFDEKSVDFPDSIAIRLGYLLVMSISVYIDNPKNEDERNLCIPVSSERFFNEHWKKSFKEFQFTWIPLFESVVTIEKDDLDEILLELNNLILWAKDNLNADDYQYIEERINRLLSELPTLLKHDKTKLYIG